MTPQSVDFNGDGINDIVTATFEGVAWVVKGTKDGFEEPERILDSKDRPVIISLYWSDKEEDYLNADRSPDGETHPEDHCTSAVAVDWDNDGDMDLLLGSYEGNLFLRRNEGTKTEPRFALTNERVKSAGKNFSVPNGMTTPRVADWDADGLFDLVCGGVKGGVYYFRNIGSAGEPKFAASETLVKPLKNPGKVPVFDGQPMCPATSYHPEVVDYDNDGDLDLVIGGRCEWYSKPPRRLTEQDKRKQKKLEKALDRIWDEQDKFFGEDEEELSDAEFEKIAATKEFQALETKMLGIETQLGEYSQGPDKSADYVWLYRRK